MSERITGGELVVRLLVSLGVRHVFGVPGGQTLAITDAIRNEPAVSFVTTRHEGAAAVMADAYGRLTGRPGVCIATTGPGATNLLTGVGGAMRDSSPCIVITCNNNGENIHKDDAQNADHVSIFRPLTKWSRLVAHGSGIKQAIEEAYVQAVTGTPGPVLLDFARDAIESTLDAPPLPSSHPLLSWVDRRPCADSGAVSIAVERITAAKRPVLWVGNGAKESSATSAILAFAELMEIPVLTTFNGIGVVPTTHPLVFGALSRMGTSLSSRVISESDLVIALGNSLNAVSTGRWSLQMPAIIQIDIEPTMIGRYYSEMTFGLVGDARTTLETLTVALRSNPTAMAAVTDRRQWTASLKALSDAWWADSERAQVAEDGQLPPAMMSPAHIVRALRRAAPDDTLLIPDAGNPGVWSYLWEIRQSGTYMKPVGFGNMGFALPAAIAASVLASTRPVLVLIGDGSLGMTLAEIETLARTGGRVVVVVLNDSGYGNIRQEQVLHFSGRTIGVDFGPADYGGVATALGVRGCQVSSLDTLCVLVEEAFASGLPALFDVPIDPNLSAWTYPAFSKYVSDEG